MGEDLDISKLLKTTRQNTPPPEYFEDFLREFQRRQRAALIHRPISEIIWDRILSIAPNFHVPQYAYATAAAAAIMVSTVLFLPSTAKVGGLADSAAQMGSNFSLNSINPVQVGQMTPVSTRSGGSLPAHYMLQSRPVSYDKPVSF